MVDKILNLIIEMKNKRDLLSLFTHFMPTIVLVSFHASPFIPGGGMHWFVFSNKDCVDWCV